MADERSPPSEEKSEAPGDMIERICCSRIVVVVGGHVETNGGNVQRKPPVRAASRPVGSGNVTGAANPAMDNVNPFTLVVSRLV